MGRKQTLAAGVFSLSGVRRPFLGVGRQPKPCAPISLQRLKARIALDVPKRALSGHGLPARKAQNRAILYTTITET